jgi:signal transduction histidine kinase
MSAREAIRPGPSRRSVFWRLAFVLVTVQLLAVVLAIGLASWFAYDRAVDLAGTSIRLRLDAVAEEVERGTPWTVEGLEDIPDILESDLALRFPDPVILVDVTGQVVYVAWPDEGGAQGGALPPVPGAVSSLLALGEVTIRPEDDPGWALAPVYDDAGFLAGGVLVMPLARTLERELAPARSAIVRALAVGSALVLALAIVLGAAFTWQLVRPVRALTRHIEAIGRGEFGARIPLRGPAEFDRLALSIHAMADAVAESFERLRATDRLRRELIANVGHDLRTPLTALNGRVEEARRHLADGDSDQALAQLDSAMMQARYLKRLVDDLFELAILDSPDPLLRLEPVPVAELVSDAVSRHEAECRAEGQEIAARLQPDLPVIQADGVRLLRLLDNLIVNAIRHTPRGGRIDVAASVEDGRVVVRVDDTGSGIPEDQVEQLFERYYRGTEARTRSGEGTGLGLAIARAVVHAHGGTLEAANRPGGGASFTMRLPLAGA